MVSGKWHDDGCRQRQTADGAATYLWRTRCCDSEWSLWNWCALLADLSSQMGGKQLTCRSCGNCYSASSRPWPLALSVSFLSDLAAGLPCVIKCSYIS